MRRTLVAIGIVLVVAACTRAAAEPSSIPSPKPSPVAAATVQPTAVPATPEPLPSDPELRHIVELRRSLGLSSDLAHVEAVARDPRATTTLLEIPVLPDEEADVVARSDKAHAAAEVVREYASAHGDEFGGMYVDNEGRAGLVTLWTKHLAKHEAAIRERLSPDARVVFRSVRYSERHLRSLQNRIQADLDWMSVIPAQWQSVSDDVVNNAVLLSVSSANPDAVRVIEDHFDLGEALTVVSDGSGAALAQWGKVLGRVRTAAGEVPPPAPYYLRWRSSDTRNCGVLDVAFGLAEDGTFTLPCQAGTWTIEVTLPSGDDWRPIGEGTVEVPPNGTANLEIVLTETP